MSYGLPVEPRTHAQLHAPGGSRWPCGGPRAASDAGSSGSRPPAGGTVPLRSQASSRLPRAGYERRPFARVSSRNHIGGLGWRTSRRTFPEASRGGYRDSGVARRPLTTLPLIGAAVLWAAACQPGPDDAVSRRLDELEARFPVASLMRQMTMPVVVEIESAIDARDHIAFATAYDRLTTSCNACHAAAGKPAIVIQRPTAPPLTNLRYSR
jgi:hypothetical protein